MMMLMTCSFGCTTALAICAPGPKSTAGSKTYVASWTSDATLPGTTVPRPPGRRTSVPAFTGHLWAPLDNCASSLFMPLGVCWNCTVLLPKSIVAPTLDKKSMPRRQS